LAVVLVFCVAGLTAMSMQVRCIDAAREAARLAARGGDGDATRAARTIAPVGADIEIHREAELVVATVTTRSILLPGITIRADTVAAMEPTAR
jgi:hypothetical protein